MADFDSRNNNNINNDYHSTDLNNNSNSLFKDNSTDRDKISVRNNKTFALIDRGGKEKNKKKNKK